jgi:putative DNA primase/helicase
MMPDKKVIPLNAWKGQVEQGRGGPKKNLSNLMLHIQNIPGLGGAIRYNDFTGQVEWRGERLKDEDAVDIRLMIEAAGFEPVTSDVVPAVIRHAHNNAFDPVREYLDSLKWDGVARIDYWLRDYMGAPDHEILQVFGSKFLIGAVARVYDPGCQMDNMLVFEGRQGAGKTTACSALFGREYMISSISDFKSKEASIALQGRWVAEIAELAALKKTDITDVKKFITETVDQFRPVHGKNTIDRPRRCVFVGTTNERQYLKDATGNRRFWPVPCGEVQVARIAEDRDALWAEAVVRYSAGEPWWITDAETLFQAEAIQADRSEQDPWGEVIDAWLDSPEIRLTDFVTVTQILAHAIKQDVARMARADEMRVGDHMSRRGWAHARRIPAPGQKRTWGYVRP